MYELISLAAHVVLGPGITQATGGANQLKIKDLQLSYKNKSGYGLRAQSMDQVLVVNMRMIFVNHVIFRIKMLSFVTFD